jgi:hypothetical protein
VTNIKQRLPYKLLLWSWTALGVVVVALGVYVQVKGGSAIEQMFAGSFAAVGGGVIGATISIFVTTSANQDTLDQQIQMFNTKIALQTDLLRETTTARILSREDELGPIRRTWHFYHKSRDRQGKEVWSHTEYPFDQSPGVGAINIKVVGVFGDESFSYDAEVGIRSGVLFIFERRNFSSEPLMTTIVPFFTDRLRSCYPGTVTVRSWSHDDILAPCLFFRTSQEDSYRTNRGIVVDEDSYKLDELWLATASVSILPRLAQ